MPVQAPNDSFEKSSSELMTLVSEMKIKKSESVVLDNYVISPNKGLRLLVEKSTTGKNTKKIKIKVLKKNEKPYTITRSNADFEWLRNNLRKDFPFYHVRILNFFVLIKFLIGSIKISQLFL